MLRRRPERADRLVPGGADRALISAVREELARQGDPEKAAGMQKYMKSRMPYSGVAAPEQKAIFRKVFAEHPISGFDRWQATVVGLWRGARFREERYAAIALTGLKDYREHQSMAAFPMYDEMVVTGAWWDYVDEIAVRRLGPILSEEGRPMRAAMRAWSTDDDPWRRRSAIICQVNRKADTDLDLLYASIEPNLEDKDFFIRKAIGWALRAYAWLDPDEVVRYVRANEHRLSGLSQREALKNIDAGDA
jgi:3-methyladenine DNA glycosylase AlkD